MSVKVNWAVTGPKVKEMVKNGTPLSEALEKNNANTGGWYYWCAKHWPYKTGAKKISTKKVARKSKPQLLDIPVPAHAPSHRVMVFVGTPDAVFEVVQRLA